MQNKGAIKVVVILIILACLYQLSFTLATSRAEKKATKHAAEEVEKTRESAEFAKVSDLDKAFYLDSLYKVEERLYTDSISAEKVYLGFTYKQVKEKEIKLGLDLKGGMNVMLQVQLKDLVKALSNNNQNPLFLQALDIAEKNEVNSHLDYITLFQEAWDEVAPGQRLSTIFGTYELKDKIRPESTNDQVIAVIRDQADGAISNSFNVLRSRIDRFGVTSPNIQRLGNSGRILVELPGVKEPERVRKLLQGTASLDFWPTYDVNEVLGYLQQADIALKDFLAEEEPEEEFIAEETAKTTPIDTLSDITEALKKEISSATDSLTAEQTVIAKDHPLFALLSPNQSGGGACLGWALYKDTAKINEYLSLPQIKAILPSDLQPMWTVKPSSYFKTDDVYELIAIKNSSRDGKAPLDGSVITDASISYRESGGLPVVDMVMNPEGAKIWARITADNIGKSVAVVLDGMVYSYPTVQSEITGGRSQISGNFTVEEATDLANVLKSGKLPAPATIIQEQVVGPSLGQESIHAGVVSFLIAFLLVLIYILFFYRGAGVAACVALICNLVILLGTLVSFGAVLTLPGIAGLVLTMGMAVDSNVIIYERIKEELRGGKQLRLAVKDGYNNAYSAILDGQLTTMLVGIALFIFGTGPIQGFATTLVIGIITSLLTSIFITRLIFEGRIAHNKNIKFDSKGTRNFLANTKVDFIGLRKYMYVLAGVVVAVCLGFMFTKGFSQGIDFTGGRTYVIRFDRLVNAEEVRTAVMEKFGETVEVKQFGAGSQVKLTTKYKINDNSQEVDLECETMIYDALKDMFQTPLSLEQFRTTVGNPNGIVSSDKVGPTVANDIKRHGTYAVIISLIAIFLYIAARFKSWRWSVGGITALAHDAIIVMGFYSIFTGVLPFSLDIDQTFIAAILTIIGYSINDTVVILDRIREHRRLYPKRDLKTNINSALNATLLRTFNTSGSTLVVLIAIALFGGETIRGFSCSLALGVIVGTFSSVFVAAPIMYDLAMRKENHGGNPKKGEKRVAKA